MLVTTLLVLNLSCRKRRIIVGFIILVVFVSTVVVLSILRGWVLSILWGWFVVPLGVPALSIPMAIGIAVTISFLIFNPNDRDNKMDFSTKSGIDEAVSKMVNAILYPFIALGIGWIVTFFL